MIGYLDLPSGISGDMFLGCLVDAGWSIEQLRAAITRLHLPATDWLIDARPVMKGPLRAMLVDVRVAEGPNPPSGGVTHSHGGEVHHHGQPQRNLADIRRIIDESDLPDEVRSRSIAVFTRLANAEAKVHGTSVDHIHFHEVGALDAIVDIVGTVAGVYELGIEQLYASALPMGPGWTNSQHGQIPLPAPATLELLAARGAPTTAAPGLGELVTPTGAALVCELARFEQPAMRVQKIAYGAGQRKTAWPNVARLWLAEKTPAASSSTGDSIVQIETNIDDMNPQLYAPLMDRIFGAGALDCWLTPVQMKKGRPGVVLGILAPSSAEQRIVDLVLRETTTLGVRIQPVRRYEAERSLEMVETPFGTVQIKLKKWAGKIVGAMPEYEHCRRLAEQKNVTVKQVYESALAAAQEKLVDG